MFFNFKKKPERIIFYTIIIILSIGLVLLLEELVSKSAFAQSLFESYGYYGIFFASIISGFNVIVPVPIITFMPVFVAGGLDPIISIIIISIGMTLGDSLGLLIGNIGGHLMSKEAEAFYKRINILHEKYHIGPLVFLFFYILLVPFPNEFVVVPLGFLGYKLRTIFPVVLLGNIFFNILVYAGILQAFSILQIGL